MIKKLQLALIALGVGLAAFADPTPADAADPNFVKASLLLMGPGNELFGCVGHVALRLECPKHQLDYCFSYESESVNGNWLRLVFGHLKMGMYAVKSEQFFKPYMEHGRSIVQYPLNLPPDAKQRLWKLMDGKVAEGQNLPYDYLGRSCVQTEVRFLCEALRPYSLIPPPWPARFDMTRRELGAENLAWCPWTRLFLHTIMGSEMDRDVSKLERLILTVDFVPFLRGATVNGRPILTAPGQTIAPECAKRQPAQVTPMMVAWLALALAVAGWWRRLRFLHWPLLAVQFAIGVLITHLLCISTLPATSWNWLVVPFNLVPFVVMAVKGIKDLRSGAARESACGTVKWYLNLPLMYAGVLLVWVAALALAPHQLTDPAYLIFTVALALVYWRSGTRWPKGAYSLFPIS